MKTHVYHGDAPVRLDKFLQQQEPGLPFGLWHKYLRQNKVKVNGKKIPLSTRLSPGDTVQLYLPDSAGQPAEQPLSELEVLFEDDNLLALYKPAGLLSLAADEGSEEDTLHKRAQLYLADTSPQSRALLCHRLDRGTSGVLLVAKNQPMLDFITGLIRRQQLAKTYYGLCFGHPTSPQGVLDGWLQKDAARSYVRIAPPGTRGAKPACTRYQTIKTAGPLALLKLHPETGRTHQIRVHLAGAGAPLLGDSKYGKLAANRRYRCRYQCLCAAQIRFPRLDGEHTPYSGLVISCEKPWFYTHVLDGTFP